METIIRGIVIKAYDYGEFDQIVTIVTENFKRHFITFLAQGVRKPISKNRAAILPFTYGEYEIFVSRYSDKVSKLKKGHIISQVDYTKTMQMINQVSEVSFWISKAEKITQKTFESFKYMIEKATFENIRKAKTFVLYQLLESLGYKQNFKNCVVCGTTKDLRDFQIFNGGFTCKLHTQNFPGRNINELKGFFYLGFDVENYITFATDDANYTLFEEIKHFLKENVA
ncbi:DNA repair protein RecO [Mycoplasma procyoni]|uniref:DNA repair protein RecO n=1 Tax=Mycoplasma procyoni TaxID=568784 RepID=UPI00197C0971|nr:DNA repair protein RecO [Mycoplasma procyoni]MBN3534433.1 DNA repair protein RecO [Mycoplasma procyoni]